MALLKRRLLPTCNVLLFNTVDQDSEEPSKSKHHLLSSHTIHPFEIPPPTGVERGRTNTKIQGPNPQLRMSNANLQRVLSDDSLEIIKRHQQIDIKVVEESRFLNIRGNGMFQAFNFSDSYAYYARTIFPEFLASLQTIEFMGFTKEAATVIWDEVCSIEDDDEEKMKYERACYNSQGRRIPFSGSWHLPALVEEAFNYQLDFEIKKGTTSLAHALNKVGLTHGARMAIFRIGAEFLQMPVVSDEYKTAKNIKSWCCELFRRRFFLLEELDYRVKKDLGDRETDYGCAAHGATRWFWAAKHGLNLSPREFV